MVCASWICHWASIRFGSRCFDALASTCTSLSGALNFRTDNLHFLGKEGANRAVGRNNAKSEWQNSLGGSLSHVVSSSNKTVTVEPIEFNLYNLGYISTHWTDILCYAKNINWRYDEVMFLCHTILIESLRADSRWALICVSYSNSTPHRQKK